MILQEFHHILRCPDDGYQLVRGNNSLQCKKCRRGFPILAENIIELLPSRPYPLEQKDNDYYVRLFQQKFELKPQTKGWGDLPTAKPGNRAYVYQERRLIEQYLVGSISNGLLLDISGGAGSYSLYFAKLVDLVVHNDLSVASINHAHQQCAQHNLRNVLIIRGDYYQLPFAANTFDSAICTGHTLNKGDVIRALTEMIRCLKPGGRFAIDFSNRLRHMPLFSSGKGNRKTTSYVRHTLPIPKGAKQIQVKQIGYVPTKFVLFESAYMPLDKMFQIFHFPPATFVVFGQKE